MMIELLTLIAQPVPVQTIPAGDIEFGSSGMTLRGEAAPFSGAFFVIVFNSGTLPDRLRGLSTPVSIEVTSEVLVYDEAMQPVRQEDPRAIPPGGRIMVRADFGGLASADFPRGVPVTLDFERAGRLTVIVASRREMNLPPPLTATATQPSGRP